MLRAGERPVDGDLPRIRTQKYAFQDCGERSSACLSLEYGRPKFSDAMSAHRQSFGALPTYDWFCVGALQTPTTAARSSEGADEDPGKSGSGAAHRTDALGARHQARSSWPSGQDGLDPFRFALTFVIWVITPVLGVFWLIAGRVG